MNKNRKNLHKVTANVLGLTLVSVMAAGTVADVSVPVSVFAAEQTQGRQTDAAKTVYLNGTAADSKGTADGSTKETAVNTLEKALELAGSSGVVSVCGTVTVSTEKKITIPSGVTVKRTDGFSGAVIKITGKGKLTVTGNGLCLADVDTSSADAGKDAFRTGDAAGKQKTPVVAVPSGVVLGSPQEWSSYAFLAPAFMGNGTFSWQEASAPSAYETSVQVVFTPKDAVNYDYSDVPGWDAASGKVVRTVKMTITSLKPEEEAVPEKERASVEIPAQIELQTKEEWASYDFAASGFKGDGTFAWAEKEAPSAYEMQRSVIFTPADTEKFDYSGVEGWKQDSGTVVRSVKVLTESLKTPEEEGTGESKPSDTEKPGTGENKPSDTEKPGTDENKPSDTEQPGKDESKPSDTEKPGTGENKPSDTEKPGTGENKPSDTEKPGTGENKPSDTEKPGTGENEPSDTEKPGKDESKPSDTEKPGTGENKPSDTEKPGTGENEPSDTEKPGTDENKPSDTEKPGTDENEPSDTEQPGKDESKPSDAEKPGKDENKPSAPEADEKDETQSSGTVIIERVEDMAAEEKLESADTEKQEAIPYKAEQGKNGEVTEEIPEAIPVGSLLDESGVQVYGDFIPSYVDLQVSYNDLVDELPDAGIGEILSAYELKLWDLKENEEYKIPEGKKVKVMLPLPENAGEFSDLSIAHYLGNYQYEYFVFAGDGKSGNMNIEEQGGKEYLTFETASFSPFNVGGHQIVGPGTSSGGHKPSAGVSDKPSASDSGTSKPSGSSTGSKNQSSTGGKSSTSSSKNTGTQSSKTTVNTVKNNSGTKVTRTVKTGDDSSVIPYTVSGAAALLVAAAAVITGKRRKRQ